MCVCGAETIQARTPAGRIISLDHEQVWVLPSEQWPRGLFILGAELITGPVRPLATPALETIDATFPRTGREGPFRREHACV